MKSARPSFLAAAKQCELVVISLLFLLELAMSISLLREWRTWLIFFNMGKVTLF